MKAKLIKTEVNYILEDDKGVVIASTSLKKEGLALSIKNCQAVANGYDLDELACNEIGIDISVVNHIDKKMIENSSPTTPIHEAGALGANLYHQVKGFEIGFQKALEVNADKRFTLKDMMDCWNKALTFQTHKETLGEYIQSLQQNEWDVEVEMICPHPEDTYVCGIRYGCDEDGCNHPNQVAYLDSDGCLILKRL